MPIAISVTSFFFFLLLLPRLESYHEAYAQGDADHKRSFHEQFAKPEKEHKNTIDATGKASDAEKERCRAVALHSSRCELKL